MKKLLVLIAIVFSGLTATAQVGQEGYFSVKENFIVWTKIYDTIPDLEAMKKILSWSLPQKGEASLKNLGQYL